MLGTVSEWILLNMLLQLRTGYRVYGKNDHLVIVREHKQVCFGHENTVHVITHQLLTNWRLIL